MKRGRKIVKISKVKINNRKNCFEIFVKEKMFHFPYSQLRLKPSEHHRIGKVFADEELSGEGFTYILSNGQEDTIHIDQVLEYNEDPNYQRETLLFQLTVKAQEILKTHRIRKREIIRRLHTSPAQFYRLMDSTNTHKTIDQMIRLLSALNCPIGLAFKNAA
jgi:hypothetical protein